MLPGFKQAQAQLAEAKLLEEIAHLKSMLNAFSGWHEKKE